MRMYCPRLVDRDARTRPEVPRSADLDRSAIAAPEAVKGGGIPVAQHGVRSDCPHGGQPASLLVHLPQGVDALMEAAQTPVRDPSPYGGRADFQSAEIAGVNDIVLTSGKLGYPSIDLRHR